MLVISKAEENGSMNSLTNDDVDKLLRFKGIDANEEIGLGRPWQHPRWLEKCYVRLYKKPMVDGRSSDCWRS
jgi:hypothetical protein